MAKMGRPSNISGSIAELANKMGGVRELAAQVSVDPRTVRYWASKSRNPSGPAKRLLLLLGEIHGVELDLKVVVDALQRKADRFAE